jgi:DNA replication initiation complex subunit (GINS family)
MSPYSDPKKQLEYQVEWQRKQRSKKKNSAADQLLNDTSDKNFNREPLNQTLTPPPEVSLRNAEELLAVLETAMAEVLACDSDTIARAKTVGYLVERASSLIRITELAERVLELQRQVDGEPSKNWKDASY